MMFLASLLIVVILVVAVMLTAVSVVEWMDGTDAPGGYSVPVPSNEQLAIQRYVTDPDAEVADLERDLDYAMRDAMRDPMRDFLARAREGE